MPPYASPSQHLLLNTFFSTPSEVTKEVRALPFPALNNLLKK